MALGHGRHPADSGAWPERGSLAVLTLFLALVLGACQGSADTQTTEPPPAEENPQPATSQDDGEASTDGSSSSSSSSTTTTSDSPGTSRDTASADCVVPEGAPLSDGASVELVELGEIDGVEVEGAVYPHPGYEGSPWSQWGQGLVIEDGRFFSAIGDHLGPDGNSYIYEYDPEAGELTMVADVLSYVDHEPGSWGYGKVHGQMVPGPCGEFYLSTYWGTFRDLEFDGSYNGDLLMRLDPYGRTLEALGVPVDRHGQPSLSGAPSYGLLYGEAVDPKLKPEGNKGPFFVYDVVAEEVIYQADGNHDGYRNVMVDEDGRAYFSVGDNRLAVYDPSTNDVSEFDAEMPGVWLRASTTPLPDGKLFGATRDPDRFFIMSPSGEIEDLGDAAGYTASMALAPGGEHFYYMPHAHGKAWEDGAPLIRVDDTGQQEIVIELNSLVEDGLGYTVGGTYNIAVSPDGESVYIGANVSPVGDDSGFGEVVLIVVRLS